MSLEQALEKNNNLLETLIGKIEQLNQTTENLAALRADAIQTVQQEAAPKPAAKRTAAEKKEEPKPAEEAAPPVSDVDTLSEAVKEYIAMAGDESDKRKANMAVVKEIFGKVKATKRSEVPADKAAAVEKAIRAKIAEANEADEAVEESEDDLL